MPWTMWLCRIAHIRLGNKALAITRSSHTLYINRKHALKVVPKGNIPIFFVHMTILALFTRFKTSITCNCVSSSNNIGYRLHNFKSIVAKLGNEILRILGNTKIRYLFIIACYCALSWARRIQPIISLRSSPRIILLLLLT